MELTISGILASSAPFPTSPSDYNNNNKSSNHNNHDAPNDYEAFKEQQEAALAFAFPNESSYVLGEHNQNILKTNNQNKKAK
ncbi:31901_t:CDS:2, partial [Gigaspora margarita]